MKSNGISRQVKSIIATECGINAKTVTNKTEFMSTRGLSYFDCVDVLQQVTHTQIPGPLAGLKEKPVRFSSVCDKDNMKESVLAILGIG